MGPLKGVVFNNGDSKVSQGHVSRRDQRPVRNLLEINSTGNLSRSLNNNELDICIERKINTYIWNVDWMLVERQPTRLVLDLPRLHLGDSRSYRVKSWWNSRWTELKRNIGKIRLTLIIVRNLKTKPWFSS